MAELLSAPSVGNFRLFEDGSLELTDAPDGVHYATYKGKRNGVPYLNPGTAGGEWVITMTIGVAAPAIMSGGSFADGSTQSRSLLSSIQAVPAASTAEPFANSRVAFSSAISVTGEFIGAGYAVGANASEFAIRNTLFGYCVADALSTSGLYASQSAYFVTSATISARSRFGDKSVIVPIQIRRVKISIEPKKFTAVLDV